jgi:hypothetical protein
MGEVIQFPIRTRAPVLAPDTFCGSIAVYRGENGKVGIDACVPTTIAREMYGDVLPGIVSLFEHEGRTGFDTQISERAAERVVAAAKRAGVTIEREALAS